MHGIRHGIHLARRTRRAQTLTHVSPSYPQDMARELGKVSRRSSLAYLITYWLLSLSRSKITA